jgi:hypothetical protein
MPNLAIDHVSLSGSADKGGMNLIFVCPRTDLKVQHRMIRVDAGEHEYEAVSCPACTRLHFVNCKSGKLLGHGR